jgi:hypothetical protein
MRPLGGAEPGEDAGLKVRGLWDEWSLELVVERLFEGLKIDMSAQRRKTERAVELLRFGLSRQGWLADPETWNLPPRELLEALLADADARRLLGVNRHEDVLWYHGESFELLMRWLARLGAMAAALNAVRAGEPVELVVPKQLKSSIDAICAASKTADYRVERLLEKCGPTKSNDTSEL